MNQKEKTDFSAEQEDVLKSVRISRIILPILIGMGVVGYLLYKEYDAENFSRINWNAHVWFWITASVILLIIRHLAYALRLRILSDGLFSWKKCIELVFIWEFSSAVSPTSVGGSAVALFVLSQEKLTAAKTAAIVIYSTVLDTVFFVGTLPILFLAFGPQIIRPGLKSLSDIDGWGYTFIGAYIFMFIYGCLFYYGLFINPMQIKRVLVGFTKLRFLKKYRRKAIELGDDIIIASKEIWQKRWSYHLGAFLSTATAWSCRFLLLNCLIIGLVELTTTDFFSQFTLFARLETMFVIMAFSPTPGGAGFAEFVFNGFLYDYMPLDNGFISPFIAFIWRLLTYYLYLLVGAIVIPNWIRNIMNARKKEA